MRFQFASRHDDIKLDITPLIDVVLQLVIFFMVTSSFVHVGGVTVKLPDATTATVQKQDASMTITITPDGVYKVEHDEYSEDGLREMLSSASKGSVITISADRDASFKYVMSVWDMARALGFKEIVVLTTKK